MKQIKIYLSFFILLFTGVAFLFKPAYSFAQETSNNSFLKAIEKCEEGEMNQECWVAKTVQSVADTGWGTFANPENAEEGGGPGGMIPMMTDEIANLINRPPASSVEYFADVGMRLGVVSPVYAQEDSTGWRALVPFLEIWKAFRNLSYVFFVFIFIIVGFMIMFRSKIDPQTVITVQSALPRIVVTLLLITFSYAIAGLLIDLIYIVIYTVVGLLNFTTLISDSNTVIDALLTKNLFKITFMGKNLFARAPAKAINELISGLFEKNIFTDVVTDILGSITGSLAMIVFVLVLFFNILKIFFSLAKTYVSVIIQIIFAPLVLLFNAIPGNNSFQSWIKSLLANVLVFPAVALMFLITALLIGNRSWVTQGACDPACDEKANPWCISCDVGYYSAQGQQEEVWVPPFLGFFGMDDVGDESLLVVIAFGMVLMISKVPKIVKGAFGIEDKMGGMVTQTVMGGLAKPLQVQQSYKQWRRQRRSDHFTEMQLRNARLDRHKKGG
jgi:hypothetical protein